jgi:hypothetical protein
MKNKYKIAALVISLIFAGTILFININSGAEGQSHESGGSLNRISQAKPDFYTNPPDYKEREQQSTFFAKLSYVITASTENHEFYKNPEKILNDSEMEKEMERISTREMPVMTEEEKLSAINRFESNIMSLQTALKEGESRVDKARESGKVSEADIAEAEAALAEMKAGMEFCGLQIKKITGESAE